MSENLFFQKEAQDYGIDLSLLEENLKKTPTERLLAHQSALELTALLRQAGENARQQKTLTDALGK